MASAKKATGDFILSFLGIIVYNGVLQFIVYPLLSRQLGDEAYGEVLYYIGIFSITSVALGLAAMNTRLVQRNNYEISNGDGMVYNMAVLAVFTVFICGFLAFQKINIGDLIAVLIIQILMAIRYYSEVIHKMDVNFKKYLIYYVAVAIGYGAGIGIFMLAEHWWIPFILGETAGIIYNFAFSDLKRQPFLPCVNLNKFAKSTTPLLISYLLYYLVMHLDRIIIRNVLDSESVGPYYTATLIGKTAAMVIAPLSGVIIGYITKENTVITKKMFTKIIALSAGGGLAFFALTLIGTPIFTKLFYPDYYDSVMSIMVLVNFGQVMCFVSELILTIVLVFRNEKWQMIVQVIYAVVFFTTAILFVKSMGLIGMAVATAAANGLRLILASLLGYIGKDKPAEQNA